MFSKQKFLLLSPQKRHKKAAEFLRTFHENGLEESFSSYQQLSDWLNLPRVESTFPELSDRYHLHLKKAFVKLKEHNLLIKRFDSLSQTPYLPIAIYLENLRSAQNVGSILRTIEAFRLGTAYFSSTTPAMTHKKVLKTSMGAANDLPCKTNVTLTDLPRPLIALETVKNSQPYFDFDFPKHFSLLLGNEEYGLHPKTIKQADHVIQIPLVGSKNSLNVSCAFAIIAAQIRKSQNLKNE